MSHLAFLWSRDRVQWELAVVKLGEIGWVLKAYEWISDHHLHFLPGVDSLITMSMADRPNVFSCGCSKRHSGSLSEPAAVFLISPYLADFPFGSSDIINTKIRRHILGVDQREGEGEKKRVSGLFVLLFLSKPPSGLGRWESETSAVTGTEVQDSSPRNKTSWAPQGRVPSAWALSCNSHLKNKLSL